VPSAPPFGHTQGAGIEPDVAVELLFTLESVRVLATAEPVLMMLMNPTLLGSTGR